MKITRSREFKVGRVLEKVEITLTTEDLLPEEKHSTLRPYWANLLEMRADKHIVIAVQRLGGFHRNKTKNDELAALHVHQLDTLRKTILGLVK